MRDWSGTEFERNKVVEYVADKIKEEHFSNMDATEFNKLFIEAFTRNLVQNELLEMMFYISGEHEEV